MNNLFTIFIGMVLINNMILAKFLGLCSFFGVSKKLSDAFSMGIAVTLVLLIASISTSLIFNYILVPYELEYMNIVIYILVIASLVQIVEVIIKRTNIALYNAMGIYLPLITTNCIVMAITLLNSTEHYSVLESVVNALGAGVGYTFVIIIMSGIREKLDLADTPKSMRGLPVAFLTAALLALAFVGFNGMV
ncbi:MAG: RnfABCDGE type electron transport complex subunit A [Actinomycetota bacterium]|nr:RnfABCDGE type electron transport complex subunit A [Actinomycetota bacterium]MDD5601022.1 RnfABCDGE type electron transport complex subunit A [Actinomycetota bacterium]